MEQFKHTNLFKVVHDIETVICWEYYYANNELGACKLRHSTGKNVS